nr:MAG TPA_asm: hypothetical protein [Caudoviricetes sp.]
MKFVIPRRIDLDRWTLVNVTIEAIEVVHDLEASKKSQLETKLTANELKFLAQQINKRASISSNHESEISTPSDGEKHDCNQRREIRAPEGYAKQCQLRLRANRLK